MVAAITLGWHYEALEPMLLAQEQSAWGSELSGVAPHGRGWLEPVVDVVRWTKHGGDTLVSTCTQQRGRGREINSDGFVWLLRSS